MHSKSIIHRLEKKNVSPRTLHQIKKTAAFLLTRLEGGFIDYPDKEIRSQTGYFCEIFLVDDSILAKNVYAYPAPKNFPHPHSQQFPLGEIYLNPNRIAKEEFEIEDWKLDDLAKLKYLLIHGFLHLLGYEHEAKNDTIAMQEKEQLLLKELCAIGGK